MVPKINSRGKSFKGLAAYLLHDQGAQTAGRVAWTEVVNIGTSNPDRAWKAMALTAMNADYLKEKAGIKRTGRQSKDCVLHVSLSWSPEEKPSRQEMSDFARRALKALNAEDRQAMMICHTDDKHPHVHLMINRVSSRGGRLLSSSNEKLALSALALAYEKENGQVLCQERAANAAKRQRGEYVRGKKDRPRQQVEALKAAEKEAAREMPQQLKQATPEQQRQAKVDVRTHLCSQLDSMRDERRPGWRALYQRQRAETGQAQQQKLAFVARVRSLFISKEKAGSLALPFQRQNVRTVLNGDKLRPQKQRAERAKLGRSFQDELRTRFAEAKATLQQTWRQLFVANDRQGPPQQFRPAASGQSSAPPTQQPPAQTDAQRYRSELAKKFAQQYAQKPKPPAPAKLKDRERDRDWEPEL